MYRQFIQRGFFLLLLLIPLAGAAQTLTDAEKDKLDPRLQRALANALPHLALDVRAPAPGVVNRTSDQPAKRSDRRGFRVFVRTPSGFGSAVSGIRFNSVGPEISTARVTAEELLTLARSPQVSEVALPSVARPANDIAAAMSGVKLLHRGGLGETVYRGQGTLTCIIDSGIDWGHGDFRGLADSTSSRLVSIWDQTLQTQSGERTPAQRGGSGTSGFTYGVEYLRSDIENEIDGSPTGAVRTDDPTGHGTHVAGTAAGNGGSLRPRRYVGMAPESQLIVVKAGDESFPMTNVIDGMNYCGAIADRRDKPVVINMSLGVHSGPHDGTSFSARAVDGFLENTTGKVVVTSAGNLGDTNIHQTATIPADDSVDIRFDVPSYTPSSGNKNDDLSLDIWFDGAASVRTDVRAQDSLLISNMANGSDTTGSSRGSVYMTNVVGSANGDRNVEIEISDGSSGHPPRSGAWVVRLVNESSSATRFHAWLYDSDIGTSDTPVRIAEGDGLYTVNSPGTADRAISVGAYAHRWLWRTNSGSDRLFSNRENRSDDLASFSSRGPRRDGKQKPDLTAPGMGIVSTLSSGTSISSSRIVDGGRHMVIQGTSMSTPVVTGSAALLLQEDPSLDAGAVKSLLTSSAASDPYTGSVPNDSWGYGKLDAFRAVASAAGSSRRRSFLSYDEWNADNYADELVTASKSISLRFAPAVGGHVPGVLLHTYRNVDLSNSVEIAIWTDDGSGRPKSQIGSTANISPAAIRPTSWNYLELASSGARLSAGSTYHLVVSLTGSGDSLSVLTESANPDGRSGRFSGGEWTAMSSDLHIRPEVGPAARATSPTGTTSSDEIPSSLRLHSNYPNPFNPATVIPYSISRPLHVRLTIYNLLGQELKTLVDRRQQPGRYEIPFDASELPSGVYLYRLEAGSSIESRAMTLVR